MARPPQQRDWSPPRSRTGVSGTWHSAGSDVPGGYGTRPGQDRGTGGRGGPSGESGSAVLWAFARAWAAGIVVLVITEVLQMTLLYDNAVGPHGTESTGGSMLLVHLPNMLCIALAAWAAGRVHPEPGCELPLRHAIAVCAVPVAGQVFMVASLWKRPGLGAMGFWLSTAVLVTGCVLGWTADRLQRGHEEDAA